MLVGGKYMDMTDAIVENYQRHNLDVLVCIGGGGTHKNAYRLMQKGCTRPVNPSSASSFSK
jgi:6-phosphofructokinase 1